MAAYSRFDDIPLFGYDQVVADPPWDYQNWSEAGEGKNAKTHYDCMSLDKLKALKVGDIVGRDAMLWLWATNPLLDQAFDLLRAWGFTFKTGGSWAKLSKNSRFGEAGCKQHMGPGYLLRGTDEPYLIGTMGSPKIDGRSVRSTIIAPVREHSRKPDEAIRNAETMMPGARRIELFSRTRRPGWDCFGNETGKFAGAGES